MKEIDQACAVMAKMDHLQELLGLREYNDVDEPLEVTVSTQLLDLVMFEIRDTLCRYPDLLAVMKDRHGAGDADRSAELTTAWMAGAERERDREAAWRPIESAPTEVNDLSRCGEPLLLGGPDWVETGFYHDGSDCYGHRGEAGWFALEDWGKDKLLCASNIHPTHWRPLPAPPRDDAARAGERGSLRPYGHGSP